MLVFLSIKFTLATIIRNIHYNLDYIPNCLPDGKTRGWTCQDTNLTCPAPFHLVSERLSTLILCVLILFVTYATFAISYSVLMFQVLILAFTFQVSVLTCTNVIISELAELLECRTKCLTYSF